MSKKNKLFLILFLLIGISSHFSQHALNHRRYWFYRARFINDFIKLGTDQGDCISFPQRNDGAQFGNLANIGPDQIDQVNMYLAALALEYKLLSRNSQDTKETIKEIYEIIETYNRLDEEAEQLWSTTPPTSDFQIIRNISDRNGFLLRGDMPENYFKENYNQDNFLHFNYAYKEYNNTFSNNQISFSGLPKIEKLSNSKHFSGWDGFNNGLTAVYSKKSLTIPHDKYYSMFFAFMFIVKYLPDNLTYVENNVSQPFADGETKIKQEVKNITNRCHKYLRGSTFASTTTDWIMEYPDGSDLDFFGLGSPLPFFAYPLVNTICRINSSFPWISNTCLGYSDPISVATNVGYITISSTSAVNEDNAVFLAYNHCSSNTYPGPTPLWLKMQQNTAIWDLEWADLARKVLHQNGIFTKQKEVYENPINQAHCKGPWNFGNCNHAGCEWSATDRMEHPKRRSAGCASTSNCIPQNPLSSVDFPAHYPGVDYMLLHNLYYEHLNQKDDQNSSPNNVIYKNAYNLMDNKDEWIWPYKQGNLTFGTNSSPMNIKVFQNLTSRAQIYATNSPLAPTNAIPSKVEYRAGKEITLLPEDPTTNAPGFEVKAGSDFYAYIKRYICGQDDYTNGMRQGADGEEIHSSDYESDEMNTEIPIHYVEYTELSDADKYPIINEGNDPYNPELIPGQDMNDVHEEALIKNVNEINGIDNTLFENIKRFEVLPNPSTGIFKVVTNKIDLNETLSITIIDMKGNTVYSNTDFKTTEINLSPYAKGIYMLHMNSSLGQKYSKRLSLVE